MSSVAHGKDAAWSFEYPVTSLTSRKNRVVSKASAKEQT